VKKLKLKTLAAICRKNGQFDIFGKISDSGEVIEQWLGTPNALYPIRGVPYLDEESLCTLFDITERQHGRLFFKHEKLPEWINFSDTDQWEILLDREKISIGYSDRVMRPIPTEEGLEFLDIDFLSPLSDTADELELYLRKSASGTAYIAAKVGFMIIGVFTPIRINSEEFVTQLEQFARKCRESYNAAKRGKQAKENAQTDGELPF
jgi:hypothetical protein